MTVNNATCGPLTIICYTRTINHRRPSMLSPRTFKKMCADPRVADWSDERSAYRIQSNGIWLYLAPGWVTEYGDLTIHEQTVAECAYELACTRYDPEAYVQALQAPYARKVLVELLPGG